MRICLCGSARFEEHFKAWTEALTLAGHVVHTLSVYPSYKRGEQRWYDELTKLRLDAIHLAKIEASEAVVILNVAGYLGESTLRELFFAEARQRPVYVLTRVLANQPAWLSDDTPYVDHTLELLTKYQVPQAWRTPVSTTGARSAYDLIQEKDWENRLRGLT